MGSRLCCITERWLLYFSFGLINFSATIIDTGDGKAFQVFSFILLPVQDYFCVQVLSMMCQRWLVAFTGVQYLHAWDLLCFHNWIWTSNRTFGLHLFIIMSRKMLEMVSNSSEFTGLLEVKLFFSCLSYQSTWFLLTQVQCFC